MDLVSGEGGTVAPQSEYVPGKFIVKLKPGRDLSDLELLNQRFGVSSATELFPKVPSAQERLEELKARRAGLEGQGHQRWYWWRENSSESEDYRARLEQKKNALDEKIKVQGQLISRLEKRKGRAPEAAGSPLPTNVYLLKAKGLADVPSLVAAYQTHPAVEYAQPDYRYEFQLIPSDPRYGELWGLQPDKLNCEKAWDITRGAGILVAVLDTGVDYRHEDLAANVWINRNEVPGNGIDDDRNGYPDDVQGYDFSDVDSDPLDYQGHGTHVAGTVAAVINNQRGVVGIAPMAQLLPVKIFPNAVDSTIAPAIRYAAENGADILGNSWGPVGRVPSNPLLEDIIRYASGLGCVVVFAAGNSNDDVRHYSPVNMPEVIAVAATDSRDQRASFSNWGVDVEVAAPGVGVLSTRLGGGYVEESGTSMACPHVSGLAALVLSRHPEFTSQQVRTLLKMTSDPLSVDKYIGQGRVNAFRAVQFDAVPPVAQLYVRDGPPGTVDLLGTAQGKHFVQYHLEYGFGSHPVDWTRFHTSSVPVEGGLLYSGFETWRLLNGVYTIRLLVETEPEGTFVEERQLIQVDNARLLFPMNNDILRKGSTVEIQGLIRTPFQRYTIEYGEGKNPSIWRTEGITLTHAGSGDPFEGVLASWDTSRVSASSYPQGSFYTLRLTLETPVGRMTDFVYMVYLDEKLKPGWPQYVGEFFGNPLDVQVADLDGDGTGEVIVLRQFRQVDEAQIRIEPAIFVYNAKGSLIWSRQVASDWVYAPFCLIGDIDNDQHQEIFVSAFGGGGSERIYAFRHDGADLGGNWPVSVYPSALSLILSDLDGDGNKELIARSHGARKTPEGWFSSIFVIDHSGRVDREIQFPNNPNGWPLRPSFPAVGHFDDDPNLEIVCQYGASGIAVYHLDGSLAPGFPVFTNGQIFGSPAVGDVDGDGYDDVVVAVYRFESTQSGGVYVFGRGGSLMSGWPVLREVSFWTTPSLADFDGDGTLEISIGQGKNAYLLDHTGRMLPGWPRETNPFASIMTSNAIGDINGDGRLDLVTTGGGFQPALVQAERVSSSGGVYAWNSDGTPIDLNPRSTSDNLFTEIQAHAPVVVQDVDGDGKIELIATSNHDARWVPMEEHGQERIKNRSSIYVWGLEAEHRSSQIPWPMFQRDPQRTGRYTPPPNGPPLLGPIGNKIILEGQALTFTISASDPDGDSLTYSASNLPSGAAFNSVTGILSWTPSYTQAGVYEVTFAVSDGSLTDRKDITITVVNVNAPPQPGSIVPVSGSSAAGDWVTFTTTFTDEGGVGNLQNVYLLVNPTASLGSDSYAYLRYNRARNLLFVRNNNNTGWTNDGKTPGSSATPENRKIELKCRDTVVSASGNTLTITWRVKFKSDARGAHNSYLRATDTSGADSGFVDKGDWTVR